MGCAQEGASWGEYYKLRREYARLTAPPKASENGHETWRVVGNWPADWIFAEIQPAYIDHVRSEWTPLHYAYLRALDSAVYTYNTLHWRDKSVEQERCMRLCERCDCEWGYYKLHAHHLHYVTVGSERIQLDFMTLCRSCHELQEGHSFPAIRQP